MTDPSIDELRAAFPTTPLDADRVFYMYSDAELCERCVSGKRWDEVDPRVLANRSDALAFLDHERFLSWLPAYLNLLEFVDPLYSTVPETLFRRLMRPDPEKASSRKVRLFDESMNPLTSAQRRVVAHSLERFIARVPGLANDARCALERYWAAFA